MDFPGLPNPHALATLLMTVIALGLFTREKIPLETSSLVVLSSLTVAFELFPFRVDGRTLHAVEFFHGFGHEALVAVCALMIAGHGLQRTGALEPIGHSLAALWARRPGLSLLLTLVVGAATSAFINNVPVVVLLMPILISVSLRTKTAASSSLMPMAFATILGGTSTSIGTSTNLLVVTVAADIGLRRMEMFDFLFPAAVAGGVGILYLWLVAPRLIPVREMPLSDTSPRVFTAHLAILEGSRGDGKKLSEVMKLTSGKMKVKSVERGPNTFVFPLPDVLLRPGDHLVVADTPDRLKEFEMRLGGALYPEGSEDQPFDEEHPLRAEDQQIAEVVVVENSPLAGTTLSRIRFAERYKLITLALHRTGREHDVMRDEVGDVTLEPGDVLLVQGPREQVSSLKRRGEVLVLDATADLPFTRKAPRALAIMIGIIVAAAFGVLPIAVSATCGVLLMILTGCMVWRDATRALSVQVIMIVVTSLALGAALLKTGAAEYLAQVFLHLTGGSSPRVVLSGLILLLAVLTNIVSNNAAAVIGTPIGISIARQLGLDPEPFVLAVLFGANLCFATPMAYKTNLLIMSAGGYAFKDFIKIGTPLIIIMWLVLSWLLPVLYGIP
jgi:di/tricarboxylate transporter